jgi:peptidoglycan/LPS O-acetylase OafA/YrhL
VATAIAFRAGTYVATADPGLRGHLALQTPALVDGFAAGVLMSLRIAGGGAPSGRRAGFAPPMMALAAAMLLLMLAHHAYARHIDDYYAGPVMTILHRSLVAAGCAALVLAAVTLPAGLRVPSLLMWLGRVSYGIYLWHGVLLFGVVDRFGAAWTVGAKAAFVLGGSLLLADASYRIVERPAQRWIVRRFPTSGERTAATLRALGSE